MCTDYRELNAESLKNRYSPPLIDDILHPLAGAKLFIALGLINAYYRRTRVENRFSHATKCL
jgi:hypothetical protein